MKYILETRNIENGEIESTKEYSSLLKMSKELNVTYCSVYNNANIDYENPHIKQPKKKSQLMFNKRYKIIVML